MSVWRQLTWWVLALPVAMVVALFIHNIYLLNYVHVMSAALWTGADVFLGFLLGPTQRMLTADQRRHLFAWLTPKKLLYLPTIAATTGTAGFFLAHRLGFFAAGSPMRPWVTGALVITAALTVLGLGVLFPNDVRTWLELRKEKPDTDRLVTFARRSRRLAAVQGILQIVIILIMAHFAVG